MSAGRRRAVAALAASLALGALLIGPSAAAAEAIGEGGHVSACYVAKGKHKGAMRIVGSPSDCRNNERPLAWGVAGPAGAQGPPGLSVDSDSLLEILDAQDTKIATLTSHVSTLNGHVTALTGALQKVCGQATLVTAQLNAIRGVVGGLGLNGVLTSLGGLLRVPALPAPLSPFACTGV